MRYTKNLNLVSLVKQVKKINQNIMYVCININM